MSHGFVRVARIVECANNRLPKAPPLSLSLHITMHAAPLSAMWCGALCQQIGHTY